VVEFIDVDIKVILSKSIRNGMRFDCFVDELKKKALKIYKLIVPSLNKPTRIKLVSPILFEEMRWLAGSKMMYYKHVQEAGNEVDMLLGEEVGDLSGNRGVLLAGIAGDATLSELSNKHANFEFVINLLQAYGHSGQERHCSSHLGLATYRSQRSSERANPRPSQDPTEVMEQQYFIHNMQINPLLQNLMEQIIKELAKNAEEFMVACFGSLGIQIQGVCDKRILTTGVSSRVTDVRQKKTNFLSFSCSSHCDTCDLLTGEDLNDFKEKSGEDSYIKMMMETMEDEIGLPTSCQYFHVWGDPKMKSLYDVNAYFIHRGLGVAHALKHMDGVSFLGYAYTHCTSFCYLTTTTEFGVRTVTLMNDTEDIFSIVAWGTSGGSSEYRRATRNG
jgi:hypothetical protein